MNNPEYVKVDGELYKIDTDFRTAIECNDIAQDNDIGDYERGLAIIYKLFGEKGLKSQNQGKLLELGTRYISFNKNASGNGKEDKKKHVLDFKKSQKLIANSFKYDYGYNPYELEYMHWYDFYNDLENLSTSEFGNCCALNRIMSIINKDGSKIKDNKERQEFIDLQKDLIEKYCVEEKVEITKEQEESAIEFYKSIGIKL